MPVPQLMDFEGTFPRCGPGAFVAPGAAVIGDVVLGEDASVWFNAVIRGDVFPIRIGDRTNIQDGAILHVTSGVHATTVGDDVTVGHGAIVHGCTIEDRCLIGMGSVILDGAHIGEGSLIAAGAVVPPGMQVPPGSVVMGSPGKIRRQTTDAEKAGFLMSAAHYVELARRHARPLDGNGRPHPDGALAE